MGLGHVNLGLYFFAPGKKTLLKSLSLFLYRALQVGTLFLAVEGSDLPLVIDATRTDVRTPWETECWGFDYLPPNRNEGADAYRSLCATICEGLVARDPVPPPMLIEEPAQLVTRMER